MRSLFPNKPLHQITVRHISQYSPLLSSLTKDPNMKFSLASALPAIALLSASAQAWSFVYGNPDSRDVAHGVGNRPCTPIVHAPEWEFEWENAWFSWCVITLYKDSNCEHEAGYSGDDWKGHFNIWLYAYKIDKC